MLQIVVPASERYDEVNNLFINTKEQTIKLEHSLVSISKWETKWNKPFLATKEKTMEETKSYVKCMALTQNVDPEVYESLTAENYDSIKNYINAPMTATWFSNVHKSSSGEVVTSEIIYYWMITLNIPFECQKWHLNRLLTLVKVCNEKNAPSNRMSKQAILSRNKALNDSRRARLHTKG